MAPLLSQLRRAASRYSVVSYQSLALWRCVLGLTCVQVVLRRWSMLQVFYAETGAYPVAALRERPGWQLGPLRWVSSEPALHLVFALCLLVTLAYAAGLWTRVVKWLLLPALVTLHARTPALLTGGELVMHLQALYSILFPLGKVWSVDAWLSSRRGQVAPRAEPPSTATENAVYPLVLLQLAVIYLFNVFAKYGDTWHNGTAVARALGSATLVTHLGAWVAQWPTPLLHAMTRGTLIIEGSLPLLLLTPWYRRQAHALAGLMIIALHGGILLTLDVGSFSMAMISHVPLLWHSRRLEARVDAPSAKQRRWQGLAALALAYVMAARLSRDLILFPQRPQIPFPSALYSVTHTMGLWQAWMMFSPDPPPRDFIVVTDALTRSGRHFDPWREIASGHHEPLRELPVSVVREHAYTRYENIMSQNANSRIHPYFARWILAQHLGSDPVERFDAWLMVLSTDPRDVVPAETLEQRAGVMPLPFPDALPITGFEARGVWAPERALDHKIVPEGTHVLTPVSANMSAGCPSFTLDLGQAREVRGAFFQADAIDDYFIDGSVDGKEFRRLGEMPGLPGQQHKNRVVVLPGEPVRFIRLRPARSRAFRHYLSEVALFEHTVSIPPSDPKPQESFITSLARPTVVGIVSGSNHPSPDCPAETFTTPSTPSN